MQPIQYSQRFTSEEAMVEAMIDIANLMTKKDNRLLPIEKTCLSVLIMANNRFGDITSKTSREWIIQQMSRNKQKEAGPVRGKKSKTKGSDVFTLNSLSRYRSRLKEKGWIQEKNKKFIFIPIFDTSKVPFKRERIFVFSVAHK